MLPINIASLKTHLMKEGRLKFEDAFLILNAAKDLFSSEKNVLVLSEPVTVVGDIHGQFYDLVKLLQIGGEPLSAGSSSAGSSYLFLGDYVDRGCFSCEVVLLLLSYKVCYPNAVFLTRGNHETRHLTTYFNFKEECLFKYSEEFYEAVIDVFDTLPLAAMVGSRFFCVHGGLSPDVTHVDDIHHIHRFREVPSQGAMCDLLWSDPLYDVDNPSEPSPDGYYQFSAAASYNNEPSFTLNDARGCGYFFNFACLKHFITENGILCVIRAHESQDEGYRLSRSHPNTQFPAMLTIFSAPNYCDTYDNKGAIVLLTDGKMHLKQFYSSPHPYYLSNFMNAFVWSLPFVWEKTQQVINDMMMCPVRCEFEDHFDWFELPSDEEDDVQETLISHHGVACPPPGCLHGGSLRGRIIGIGMLLRELRPLS